MCPVEYPCLTAGDSTPCISLGGAPCAAEITGSDTNVITDTHLSRSVDHRKWLLRENDTARDVTKL